MSLKRKTPLKRGGYIVKHRAKRLDRESPDEARYRAWVHTQPCVGSEIDSFHVCHDRLGRPTRTVEQSHIRHQTGIGLKPNELQSLPMCGSLHVEWEETKGVFAGMSRLEMWVWAQYPLAIHHARFKVFLITHEVPA